MWRWEIVIITGFHNCLHIWLHSSPGVCHSCFTYPKLGWFPEVLLVCLQHFRPGARLWTLQQLLRWCEDLQVSLRVCSYWHVCLTSGVCLASSVPKRTKEHITFREMDLFLYFSKEVGGHYCIRPILCLLSRVSTEIGPAFKTCVIVSVHLRTLDSGPSPKAKSSSSSSMD